MRQHGRRQSFVARLCLIALILASGAERRLIASEHYGQVTFGGLPIPGATVTASQGDQRFTTSTDQRGVYRLRELEDGLWSIRVEMLGFSPESRDVLVSANSGPAVWELKLLSFEEIARGIRLVEAGAGATSATDSEPPNLAPDGQPGRLTNAPAQVSASSGFQRAGVSPADVPRTSAAPPPGEVPGADSVFGAAEGLLVNGSVSNAAASPFAQLAAFGNNRRNGRSLYTGGVAAVLGNSAFDASPFSFVSQSEPKPSYSDVHVTANIGGPLRIPGHPRSSPNVFVGYQRTSDHTANTQTAIVPTALERIGDFSRSVDAWGRPQQIIDPATGTPFPGNAIPADRISPQAASLLAYYPFPNLDGRDRFNYQAPLVTVTRQDSIQTRITQPPFGRNQTFGNFAYQRKTTESTNVFGFTDSTQVSGVDAALNWSRRFTQAFSARLRYQFTRVTTGVTPFFANRTNVSGDAGIAGNNQDAVNWGPPTLSFASGFEPLATAQYALNTNQTNSWSGETLFAAGRHSITAGGGVHRNHVDILAQQNARGAFTFTGATTGSDLADFVLGIPHASSIAFGNADKYLRGSTYELYVADDVRFGPGLTVNAGLRWEYEAPLTERFGRLVNLDVAPGFAAVAPIVAGNPIGALTGTRYPASLLLGDKRGVQPRIGAAWRPVPGSSLVVRTGYGVYRNTAVYQSIATLMAQQPPLSTSFSIENTPANPLSLANGFSLPAGIVANTFAVDPDFRVGYAHNWQASVQKDLPASLTLLASYLGTKGSRLMQEFLPNTFPAGADNPCPTCPAGFVYLTSGGRSIRHAGQIELRRRLRNGFSATGRYTLSRATDDAGAFTGVSLNGSAIAQDWLALEGEWGPSTFDQRHLFTAQIQYSTGVGVAGGTLVDGIKGSLLKGWTVTAQMTAGSGLPLTPVYLTSVAGTGVTGTIRPDYTGSAGDVPEGFYANPAAFSAPASGRWGNARRNSITGPAQFGLNAGIARTFAWGDRLNLDWRIDAMNALNRVTYSGVNTLFGSPQFGLPNRANAMRKVQTSVRVRF